VNDNIERLKAEGKTEIDGATAFTFYDTYGFPIDLTQDMAEESGMTVDEKGFEDAMKAQRELSKKSKKDITAWDLAFTVKEQLGDLDKTEFVGYEQLAVETTLAGMIADGQKIEEAEEGQEVFVVLPVTPFYAMSGGQAGDHGVITGATGKIVVDNTEKMPDGKYVHHGVVSGTVMAGEAVSAQVDEAMRQATARNHTATHLLHKALRDVLGDHVHQAGSSVDAQRLRFDFSHMTSVSAEELAKVELAVNEVILQAIPVNVFETGIEEAKKLGFTALFGEKYGDVVRCVQAGDYSMELCGGTHVANISQIGLFKIVSEGAVAAGVRRVEAVTGMAAYQYALQKEQLVAELGKALKTPEKDLVSRVEQLGAQNKELEKEIAQLHAASSKNQVDGLLNQVKEVNGVKLLACEVEAADMNSLRDMSDMFRDKLGSGVVVLGAKSEGGVNLIVAATKDLTKQGIHAGNIIKEIAKVTGGGGGGRPDMAQAGGKDYSKLAEALALAEGLVAGQLK
ncbi:MAG: alanine--tRNA ligase, partial [Peptococcaceae bacterium]|nr:alanine--tRNA ligase [Peptococcaceae bacterium]